MDRSADDSVRSFKENGTMTLIKILTTAFLAVILLVHHHPAAAAEYDNSYLMADAADGDPEAQYTLAHLYLKGRGGIERNTAVGIRLLEQAVSGGHKEAALDLALLYLNGVEVDKDNKKALDWFRTGADLGQVDAQYFLGLAYKPIDMDEALRWLRSAALNGQADAAEAVKQICRETPDRCR